MSGRRAATWILDGLLSRFVLGRASDLARGPGEAVVPPEVGARLVEAWMREPETRRILLEVAREIGGDRLPAARALEPADIAWAEGCIAGALAMGSLVLLESPRILAGAAVDPEPPLPPRPTPVPPRPVEKTWIAVSLLDATGAPMSGQAYRIVLPGGAISAALLDASGRVEIDDINPGMATIAFPKIDRPAASAVPPEAEGAGASGATSITRRDKATTWPRRSGSEHVFQLRRRAAHVFEVETFSARGGVLLPGPDPEPPRRGLANPGQVTGIGILAACLRHARDHQSRKLVITGHALPGSAPDTGALSRQRAESVLAVLMGDRQAWVDGALAAGTLSDIQLILRWAAKMFVWACDPGEISGTNDARTGLAVKAFQRSYNIEIGGPIFVDGKVGPQTWGAVFDVITRALLLALGTDAAGLSALRGRLAFVPGRRTVGSGENHPDAPHASAPNRRGRSRRAEVLFFDPGDEPEFVCEAGGAPCQSSACELYDPREYLLRYLAAGAVGPIDWMFKLFIHVPPFAPSDTAVRLIQDGKEVRRILVSAMDSEADGTFAVDLSDLDPSHTYQVELVSGEHSFLPRPAIPIDEIRRLLALGGAAPSAAQAFAQAISAKIHG